MTDPRYVSPVPPYGGPPQDRLPGEPPLQGVVLHPGYAQPGPGSPQGSGPSAPYSRNGDPHAMAGRMTPGLVVRPVRQKSLLLAALLAGLFPPLGMLYATFLGTVVMGLLFSVAFISGSSAWPSPWFFCVVWAVWAAHRKNQRRLARAARGW